MESSIITTITLGIIGLLITFYYSWHSKKIADAQLQKELFTEFNSRYNRINNNLAEIEKKYSTIELLEQAGNSDELKQVVIDFFCLCAEEFYWYNHKRQIDNVIWQSWHIGMNYWYQNVPVIKTLWQKEITSNGKLSYNITDNKEFFIDI